MCMAGKKWPQYVLQSRWGQTSRRVGNWTHVLSVLGVHMIDIGCQTHGFGTHFSWWYSPCHCVLVFFLRFAMFSAFMSFQKQRFFFFGVVFLKYAGFSTSLRASYKLLDKDATTYQERLTSYKTKILQRIRNVFQVTGRRSYKVSGTSYNVSGTSYNVSGTSDKLLDEELTTYQERLPSYWTKILQRIRNVLQVTGRRSYNVSGTSYKLLGEYLTTYQERLTSYWTKILKILQRIRNVWQVTGRRC